MVHALQSVIGALTRFFLALRYRVAIRGLESIKHDRGVLILPNHPGYTDPPLVLSHLWPKFGPRPMLLASVFRNPLMFWLPRALSALEIPDLGQHSTQAREQTEASIRAIVEGLAAGQNFILWPSGRVQRAGQENIGSTRSVASILEHVPDVRLVLVRSTGLRGSMFSYARTGAAPHLPRTLLKGVGLLLANLLFFMPRRRVEIEVESVDRADLPGITRETLNPYLETFYNQRNDRELRAEPPVHVPYHFAFGARTFDFPEPTEADRRALGDISEQTKAAVTEMLRQKRGGEDDPGFADHDAGLDDFGFDSLDRMELALQIEDRFGFRGADVPETVGDLWELAEGLAGSTAEIAAPPQWRVHDGDDTRIRIEGETILEALFLAARRHPKNVVTADDLSGVLTYERFLVGVQVLAKVIRERVPAQNVGVMLPASVATDLLIFAVHYAGKTPVMANWTTGPKNLAHAAQTMRMTHVITSHRFVDRMAIEVDGADYLFVEDMRKSVGKLAALWTLLRTKWRLGHLIKTLPETSPRDPAVILFTSGSEKAPKAVPLSHHNILSNLCAVTEAYDLYQRDVLLGFLPPFHSFGFTVTVMLPILGGARVVHHPDPTDAGALGRKLKAYGATLLGATPTFLGFLLERSAAADLQSLRIAVVGGEKCPGALFDRFHRMLPDAELLEGYGVTECSPLVSATRPDLDHEGSMGLPLPGVEMRLVDPDTREPTVGTDEVGMLLVAGPNVFAGYLEYEGASPFQDIDGTRYYVTGDLALRDAEQSFWFRGRLTRFLKAGGEMVSLPAIEAPITQHFPPGDDGPRVAVEGIDEPARHVVLFTTETITLHDANAILTQAGLRGVMRLDAVEQVDAIPVLGTGKIDYKILRKRLADAATK